MPWASVEVNTPMLDLRNHRNSAAGSFARRAGSQHDHAHLHEHSRDLLPHDAQRQGGVPGQTRKGFEQSSCKSATGLFGQTLNASTTIPDRNGGFQPWGILHEPLLLCSGRPKAPRSSAQLPPGLQKFCGCKTLEPTPSDGAFLQVLNP